MIREADLRLGLVPMHVHLRRFHPLVEDWHKVCVCVADARGLASVVEGSFVGESGVVRAVRRRQHRQVVSFLLPSFEKEKQ